MFLSRWVKILVFTCIVCLSHTKVYSQYGNEEELKKQAAKYFEDEDYTSAYKAYSQLVSNYPKDPNYNYRLGVCMLYTVSDKKKCFPYLEFANKNIKDSEKEARFYLAKAYHTNFRFDEAIKLYTQYKEIGSGSMVKKLKVDREIQSCKNGKRLLSDLNELVVLEKKQLAEGDYFRSYNLSDIGGKLLVKPENFITANDKKKKNKSIVYLPKSNDRLFYSSYGTGDNKDIFIVKKLPNGDWSKPENIGSPVNTEFDEDYPFLHPNGKVLYFASQGHNSMGGYDIFKSELDEATGKWKTPVNMDFPINTPNDDILFVTDSLEKTAYFSSTRQSPNGKIDVYKINTERRPPEFIYIKGNVLKKSADQRVDSKITVKDINAGENIGSFQADVAGNYLMKIPNGGKFIFTVETQGFTTQSEGVDVPVNNSLVPYRQIASYDNQKLVLQNLFETNKNDENAYLQYIEIIEQKSKMDVNASDFTSSNVVANNTATNNNAATNTNNTNTSNDNTNNTNQNNTNGSNTNTAINNTNSTLNNTQLEKIAFDDANELKLEAIKLKSDANDAFTFVENQKFEASQKNKEALAAIEAANTEQNTSKKEALQTKANELKEDAKKLEEQSKLAENIARNLENDANLKQREADLQLKYAEQLKEVNSTKNNKAALTKLETIQKELEALSKEKSTVNELSNSINADIARKEEELTKLDPIIKKNKNEVSDLESEIKNVDLEISNTKDKDLKNNLIAQRDELTNELTTKKNELKAITDKADFITNEREALKSQSDFANNMITQVKANENLTPVNNNAITTNNTNTNENNNGAITNNTNNNENNNGTVTNNTNNNGATTNNTTNFTAIKKETEDKINALNSSPESSKRYEEQKQLNNDLIASIAKEIETKKTELKAAKKTDEKKEITDKIKELEVLKSNKESDNTVYNSKIADQKNIENNGANNVASNANNTNNTNTNNNSENNNNTNANISSQINELSSLNNSGNDNKELFSTNFTNNEAIQIKQKAEADYNAAIAKGIANETKINELKNTPNNSNDDFATRSAKLNAEIDQLYKEASTLRKEAGALTGNLKTEKLKQAKEKEDLAANKKFELAKLTTKENEAKFELNQKIIDEYIAANGTKSNSDIDKAKNLINDASTLYKQAIKIEEEANAEQDIAAKGASYSNVEEKEMEALTKQEEAIALFKKNNPNFNPTTKAADNTSGNNDVSVKLDAVKKDINQKNIEINNSLLLLIDANEKEFASLLSSANGNNSNESTKLKTEAEELKLKAEKEKNEALLLQNETEKNVKLVAANKTYQAAINKLNEANKLIISSNNNTATNNTNENNNIINNNNGTNNTNENNNTNNTVANNNNGTNNTNDNNNTNNTAANNNNGTNNTNNAVVNNNNGTNNTNENNNTTNNNTSTNNTNENNNANNNNGTNNNTNGNNNVNANNTNENNTVTSNTVTPSTNKLSAAEITKIKESPEYKNYTAYNDDAKKYDEIAIKENDKAKAFWNQASMYLKESNDLRIETDNMPDGEDRKLKLDQAIKLDHLANEFKAKGDSVNELANNTRAFADSKKMESEAYASSLDPKTREKILAVSENKNTSSGTNNNENTNGNIANNNNPAVSNKFDGLSDGFKTNATQLEADLKTFENAEPNQGNLEAQNQLLTKYNVAIDSEIKNEKKKLATANATQKTTINNRIKSLENQKTANTKTVNANKNKITTITNANNVANANNTNENNSNNNGSNNNTTNNNTTGTNNNTVNNNGSNNNSANNNTNGTNNNTVNNNNNGSNNNSANNNTNGANNNTNNAAVTGTGFKINNTNAYSASKPIPIDEKLPAGIIFAVQIGAFKNQIPNDLFKGLSPLRGETTSQGLIRYQAGRFLKFEEANGVKNDLKKLGYKDAFVVVYKDGQKLPLNEAIAQLKSNGVNVDINPNETAGITANANVPNANTINTNLGATNNTTNNVTNNTPVVLDNGTPVASKELSTTQGMLFTVQIGVYANTVSSSKLYNLTPIYREQIPSGNYRYTAGVYSNINQVKADRQKVYDLGIKDAFISAYVNGQRIKISEALAKIGSGENIQFAPDAPIQFNGGTSNIISTPVETATVTPTNNTSTNNNAGTLQPFTNGVTQGPQPTPENGVKIGDEGVTFKVQIGAYKNQVPANVANNFLKIKEWPIQASQINGLYIYSVGSFVDAKSARPLLENAKQNGIADAFITVYKDGKKLYGAAASELLNR